MSKVEQAYHHGDLRRALLEAAEQELSERGVEAFSLRGVAKRAGVSHAAPAHHFGDARGLLTALATVAYDRFVATLEARKGWSARDARSRLIAAGIGYVGFAMAYPAMFRLMFSSRKPDENDEALQRAASTAFDGLVQGVDDVVAGDESRPPMLDVMATWAMVHGLADLLNAGRLYTLQSMTDAEREQALERIIGTWVDTLETGRLRDT